VNPAMDDDELMAEVRAAFTTFDAVPEPVLAAGRGAIARRVPAAVPADLIVDSHGALSGRRPGHLPRRAAALRGTSRLLTFKGADLAVEVEVTGTGRDLEIVGRLSPALPAHVRIRHLDGELTARVDRSGHFIVPGVPAGLMSLVFRLPDATSIVTSWVRL
jgi:hypothetical protein